MKKVLNNKLLLIVFIFIFFIIDFSLKRYVHFNIPYMTNNHFPYDGISVINNVFGINFSINHICNKGAAWGFFSKYSNALFILRITIIASLIIYCINRLSKKILGNKLFFSISLIIAGAIGNVLDFMIYGYTIDMLHFQFFNFSYPLFNVADVMIFLGCCILIFFTETRKNANKKNKIIFNK